MASIRILKINFKTNIMGFKANSREYSILNYDPSPASQNRLTQIRRYLPPNTLFFTDASEINPGDLGASLQGVIGTLTSDYSFEKLLTKKRKENIRKNFGLFKPLTVAQANNLRIVHKNIKLILDILFAQKNIFYLTPTRPFTVMSYIWNPRTYTTTNTTYNGNNYLVYNVNVTIKLNPKQPHQISDVDYKKSGCFNQKELVKQNFNHVFGDGTYLMKSPPAINAPTATPSMLPGPGNINQPQVVRPPPVYYVPVRGMAPVISGGGKTKKRLNKRKRKVKTRRTSRV